MTEWLFARLDDMEAITGPLVFAPTEFTASDRIVVTDAAGRNVRQSDITLPSTLVSTVFGRSGIVVAANGDYTASQITNVPAGTISAVTVQAALDELGSEKLDAATYTAADVLAKLLTVDGPGSGIDADFLDGNSSAAFALAAHVHSAADITSGTLPLARGGTAQVTALAARGSAGLNIEAGTARGDAIYTILPTDRFVYLNAAFTASRAFTLPAANAVNAGALLVVSDAMQGGLTSTNTLVLTRAGADTLNGGTTFAMDAARSVAILHSDGVSKWGARLVVPFGTAADLALRLNSSSQIPAVSGALLTGLTASQLSGLATIATSGSATDLTAGVVPAARMPAHTGDITTTVGTVATVLATVNANVGQFGSATAVSRPTVNAKGLVTAIDTVPIAIPSTAVTDFTEAAQDALNIFVDSATIDFTYADATPSYTAIVIDDSITNAKLSNMVQGTVKMRRAGVGTGDPTDTLLADLKTDLALNNVDNTSDVNKPVSTAQQTALDGKQAAGATLTSLEGLALVSGDILYATAADTLERLPKGTDGQFLRLAAGIPDWATIAGGGDMLGSNNLSDVASAATAFTTIKQAASATATGVVELATDAETITGTDTTRATTPANIQAKVASATALGIVELATDAETVTGTDTARATTPANIAAATIKQGKHTIWMSAGAMTPHISSAAARGVLDTGTQDNAIAVFDFDTGSQEFVDFVIAMPKSWDEGPITFTPHWTNAAGSSTQTVAWTLRAIAISNDDTLDVTTGGDQTSTDTWLAQNDLHIGPESAALTISGSPAAGDLVLFQLLRSVASDNMTGDARLIGISIGYTVNAATDA